ncbi:MAG: isoprenylcysteine carboxylmethyltransferase family protein [Anaerolineae bacterium]|nr:isoprenylcysteine carboxylmethyltransferase family protein [Anaerolineae bacterium]
MDEHVFHVLFAVAYLTMFAIRLLSWRSAIRAGGRTELKEGKVNMAVRAVLGLGYIGALIVYVFFPSILGWAVFSLPAGVRWIGAGITFGALLLLAAVQWALGKNFNTTLHLREEHSLVTAGPYRWVRHPMYTALFLLGVGFLLLTANWAVGVPLIVALPAIVASRVGNEERMMVEQFGADYRAYMARTGRFLPRLTRQA